MYFHPLQEEIGNLSEEDISKRILELTKKYASARRDEYASSLQNKEPQSHYPRFTHLRLTLAIARAFVSSSAF